MRGYTYLDQAPQQEIDVHDGLESTLAILGHKLSEGKIDLVRDYDRTLPRIDAYAAELNQVWTNLLDNAIAAAGDGGMVTVRTLRSGDFLAVEIEDDGPGIPPEVAEQVFDAFFTTKAAGRGHRARARHREADRCAASRRPSAEAGRPRRVFQVLLPLAA